MIVRPNIFGPNMQNEMLFITPLDRERHWKDAVCTYPGFLCMDCARAIVQVGIKELVALRLDVADPQWGADFSAALELFEEANIRIRWYEK